MRFAGSTHGSSHAGSRFPRRATVVVALLAAAVLLTGVLAYQAYDSARSQRRVAEAVLNEYVAFAGWEFSRAATAELDSTLDATLTSVERAVARGGSLPPPRSEIGAEPSDCECRPMPAQTYFHVTFEAGAPAVATSGAPVSDATGSWLAKRRGDSALQAHTPALTIATLDGTPHVVGTKAVHRPGEPARALLGFIATLPMAASQFQHVLAKHPVLPPSLTIKRQTAEILSVRVADPAGTTLFASGPAGDSTYRATGTLPARLGSLAYEIGLQPAAADTLLIGGLPRSRLPLLAGLFALTAGLVVVAVVQLRREYELARLRSDFVSGVSHELRTPLAQIRMFSETMLLGRVRSEAEARRSLEIINQEAQRLGHLVENVLYFGRGERGAARIVPERRWLAPLVDDIVEAFAPLARARQAKIALSVPADIATDVDPAAFRQILLNLLDNAAKYGPVGQTITVSLHEVDGHARIAVDDEGPGVSPAEAARIWQPFARGQRPEHASVGGTGIGLAVVHDIARLHGWRASVGAAPSGGARFALDLPIPEDGQAAAQGAAPSRSQAPA